MHQIERFIDLVQRQRLGDEFVDLEFAGKIPVHEARQLRTSFHAAERRAAPNAAGDELERTRRYFLSCAGNADDRGFAPALVAALERCAHDIDIADALERKIHAAIGQVDDDLLDWLVVLLRIDDCLLYTSDAADER